MADVGEQNAILPTIGAMFHDWVNTYVSSCRGGSVSYCDIASLSRERTNGCVHWKIIKMVASTGELIIQIRANVQLPRMVFPVVMFVEVKIGA